MGAGIAGGCVLAWLTALSIVDIRRRRLPNWLTLPGAAAVLAGAAATGHGLPALLGGAALCGVYLLVHLAAPRAMGAGDVKLALGIGAMTGVFGIDVWVLAAVSAPLMTAGWALIALIARTGSTVPHGPSMCIAAAISTGLVLL